jgi:hypothetical protein
VFSLFFRALPGQLLESLLMNYVNLETLLASKAARGAGGGAGGGDGFWYAPYARPGGGLAPACAGGPSIMAMRQARACR